jgi:hypothetical protein
MNFPTPEKYCLPKYSAASQWRPECRWRMARSKPASCDDLGGFFCSQLPPKMKRPPGKGRPLMRRTLLSRITPAASLVIPRQTFVRRRHRWQFDVVAGQKVQPQTGAVAHGPRTGPLPCPLARGRPSSLLPKVELRSLTNGLPSRTNVCSRRKRTCGPQGGSPGLT